jgi:acyl carrier protein
MDQNLLEKLQPIFQEVFDDDQLQVTSLATAKDVDGWDSFSHIRLVLAVEQAFSVKFSAREINKLKNVGEFVTLIQSKL